MKNKNYFVYGLCTISAILIVFAVYLNVTQKSDVDSLKDEIRIEKNNVKVQQSNIPNQNTIRNQYKLNGQTGLNLKNSQETAKNKISKVLNHAYSLKDPSSFNNLKKYTINNGGSEKLANSLKNNNTYSLQLTERGKQYYFLRGGVKSFDISFGKYDTKSVTLPIFVKINYNRDEMYDDKKTKPVDYYQINYFTNNNTFDLVKYQQQFRTKEGKISQ